MSNYKIRAQIHENFRVVELDKKYKKRTVEDVMKTILWFELIVAKLNVKSAYEVGKTIFPDRYIDSDYDVLEHHIKWQDYQKGKHVPSLNLVEKVNQTVPGTREIFNHPIWNILKKDTFTKSETADFLFDLDIEIRKLILTNAHKIRFSNQRKRVSTQLFDALERRYSLDSLAALVILLKESQAANKLIDVQKLIIRIYRTCLVLCIELPFAKFSSEFYLLICERVFDKTQNSSEPQELWNESFEKKCKLLNRVYFNFEDNSDLKVWQPAVRNKVFFEYFRGFYSSEMAKKFVPPWVNLNNLHPWNSEVGLFVQLKNL